METIDQLGAIQEGSIFDKLRELGVTHEKYNANPEKFGADSIIGRGAENIVYQDPENPNKVQKHPHLTKSTSYSFKDGKTHLTQTTHLDKLIFQYKKILNIRIFNCVVNKAHQNFLYYNPDKISEVPYLESTNANIDKNAVIHETKISTENPVRSIEKEVAKFVPQIMKEIFFYFDTIGGRQAFKTGVNEKGQPIYTIVDGVSILGKDKDHRELYEIHKHKLPRNHDRFKEIPRIEKFQKIIKECSDKHLQNLLEEIENTFANA